MRRDRFPWGRVIGGLLALAVIAIVVSVVTRGRALPDQPQPVAWNDQACAHCRMAVGEPAHVEQRLLDPRLQHRETGQPDNACPALAVNSIAAVPAAAEASDDTVKTPRPVRNRRRRPRRSAARPPKSSRLPETSE